MRRGGERRIVAPMTTWLGILLLLHAMAHAGVGIWVAGTAPAAIVTPLWFAAIVGFAVAGLTLLGALPLRERWRPIVLVASMASLALIGLSWHPIYWIGIGLDVGLATAAINGWRLGLRAPPPRHRGRLTRLASFLGIALATYLAIVVVLRPWHMRWGVSRAELRAPLLGDSMVPGARYRIDHAVTIHARADAVWPWLAQLGQDRGGFYSYAWLERLVGDPVHNADRIVPEWQSLREGDLVRAAPPDYLGGIFGPDLGWRVLAVDEGRGFVLAGWGAFVVQPVDDHTSRLLVRTRGDGRPSLTGIALAPFGLLVIEPAHFIMQRGMLLGIKERAEQLAP
jgi:hypothetical protein